MLVKILTANQIHTKIVDHTTQARPSSTIHCIPCMNKRRAKQSRLKDDTEFHLIEVSKLIHKHIVQNNPKRLQGHDEIVPHKWQNQTSVFT